ncbi:SGNH/GDSL hydrolase family protein [Pseudarthrobacter niigatensis]|uniref:Acyl-CoA thioesterase-1 n=1 Tax=Pseudarthrobacter niigatensis TaxID=369935 RepID=A0AAJ1SW16_9MICC|nr:SGNH/GDSL hydrolase family protein [Pseudarthrobacter niigatensis]MDQ0144827.1 acyl-CoA thioesterase-1 [Pseudarthrobacter niigatensis]MDQ0264264.1 acyl-CoA thioesterase-1 [Pseudarthrobacter niigatensis]
MPPAKASTLRGFAWAACAAVSALVAVSGIVGNTGGDAVPGKALSRAAAGQVSGGRTGSAEPAVAATARVLNTGNGRLEAVVPDVAGTVLLIGDSQAEPVDGWPRLGLAAAGYNVYFCGRGGTGYVAANGATGNYIDALQRGDWLLPSGTPALIVVEGGGNDAAGGASNAQIARNAERLVAELRTRYPGTRLAMIGTLARGANDGGGRRSEVDAVLGAVAGANGLPFISAGDWLTRYGLAKDLADAVHMNSDGRRALGGILAARLRELGLGRNPSPAQGALAAVPEAGSTFQD